MSRKSSRSRHGPSDRDPLDDFDNEVATPPGGRIPLSRPAIRVRSSFSEDRRRWAPGLAAEPAREKPRDTTGRPARIVHKVVAPKTTRRSGGNKPAHKVTRWAETVAHFDAPRNTFICLRRNVRRQVLFALKRTRSGKGSPKKRNQWSSVRC